MKLGRAYVLPLGLLLAIVAAFLLGWLAAVVLLVLAATLWPR